jgi:N-acetylmuramoyl-L-alanine amidase
LLPIYRDLKILRRFPWMWALLTPLTATGAPHSPFKVVLDPGHGGGDHGAIAEDGSTRLAEKDLTLAIALEAQKHLKLKGIQVHLTRTADQDVPLSERTALANRLKADVFISIHMNSAAGAPGAALVGAEGIETYILNNTTNETSKRLAYLENTPNRPNLPQVEAGKEGEGGDVALILKDLTLDANLSESKRLACGLQSHLLGASAAIRAGGSKNRGVKQALFHVLLGADMPSALVEAGFMSSRRDRHQVLDRVGRMKLGIAIARAVDQYRRERGTPKAQAVLASCKVH